VPDWFKLKREQAKGAAGYSRRAFTDKLPKISIILGEV